MGSEGLVLVRHLHGVVGSHQGGGVMKHTPGPWMHKNSAIIRSSAHPNRGVVAVIPTVNDGGVFEWLNNVDLITAAPELYDTLKDVVGLIERHLDLIEENIGNVLALCIRDRLTASKAAIAKAEGAT